MLDRDRCVTLTTGSQRCQCESARRGAACQYPACGRCSGFPQVQSTCRVDCCSSGSTTRPVGWNAKAAQRLLLTIRHSTTYRYAQDVMLLPHRMMLIPRGTHSLRLRTASLDCTPPAAIDWTQDVFGNVIATASFASVAAQLTIVNCVVVEQGAVAWPVFRIAPHAHRYPFAYSSEERVDLGALIVPEHVDPEGQLACWARSIVVGEFTDTLALLQDVNGAARSGITYIAREEEGTQAPLETIGRVAGRAATWRRCSTKRCGIWVLRRGQCRGICTIRHCPVLTSRPKAITALPMPGRRSICPVPAGSRSTLPTGGWGKRI